MNTWSHLCNNNNTFYTLDIKQECKLCRLTHSVQSLRYQGYSPNPLPTKQVVPLKRRLAALFMPKKAKTNDENQHDYYDRHG
jgi:hypothetical protein